MSYMYIVYVLYIVYIAFRESDLNTYYSVQGVINEGKGNN